MLPSKLIRQARSQQVRLLRALVVAGFGLVVIGLFRLQVADHRKYLDLSTENHVRLEVLRAPRGAIYDRQGVLLADSAPCFNIVFRPFPAESVHLDPARRPDWVERVVRLVGTDSTEIRRLVSLANASGQTAVLRHNAPFEIRAAVEEWREELPGVEVQIEPLRRYPFGILAAHLLGYAGEINDYELDSLVVKGYRPGDLIGRTGVERTFEDILRGRDGAEFVVVNASGKRVATLGERPPEMPEAGHDLVLELDLRVQQAMEEAMSGVVKGAAVAMDPRDGAILGLVSRPAFDPNEFSIGLSGPRWRELSLGGSNPLLNRAIQGVYPPGSTFKIVTMLAALRTGAAQPETKLAPCNGSFTFGNRRFRCWKPEGHGSLDFIGALQHSCDVYFYQVGLRLGLENLEATARDLGLGERTGIDLPQEKRGLIPGLAWYEKRWGKHGWRKSLMLNLAIGQGELLLTPLQIATMLAETAMDGRALRPHVVKEVRGEVERRPERPTHPAVDVPLPAWEAVHSALELVVNAGTGTAARVQGIRVAGKTGTAQNPHGNDHALFVCYAPVEDPRIVLAFVVENSGHGGSVAAPLAGKVLNRLFLPDSIQQLAAKRAATPAIAGAVSGD